MVRDASFRRPRLASSTVSASAPPSSGLSASSEMLAPSVLASRLFGYAMPRVSTARPKVKAAPRRSAVMARMVADLEAQCREQGIPADLMAAEIVNRTIGDVDVRRISAREDGPEFVTLADDMGLALPRELIDGVPATRQALPLDTPPDGGIRAPAARAPRRYAHVRSEWRRQSTAARDARRHLTRAWGYTVPAAQIHLSLGSLDGLNKFFQGVHGAAASATGAPYDALEAAVIFPAPGFNVPEWQAQSLGLRIHRVQTSAENTSR